MVDHSFNRGGASVVEAEFLDDAFEFAVPLSVIQFSGVPENDSGVPTELRVDADSSPRLTSSGDGFDYSGSGDYMEVVRLFS